MRTYRDDDVLRHIDADSPTPLIRWSAIVGGLVLGLASLALLSSLWLALAYGSDMRSVLDNIEWFVGVSGIIALFVAAILTGYLSGVRGFGTGMLHGFTLWGALLIITLTVGIPSVLNVFSLGVTSATADGLLTTGRAGTALWAGFWTILGGFVAAGVGGAIGGAMSRGVRTRTRTVVLDEADHGVIDSDRDGTFEGHVAEDDHNTEIVHDGPIRPNDASVDADGDGIDDDAERRSYRVS